MSGSLVGVSVVIHSMSARWYGRTSEIGESDLSSAISTVRSALGDNTPNPRFIEMVTRRGERAIANAIVVCSPQKHTRVSSRRWTICNTSGDFKEGR